MFTFSAYSTTKNTTCRSTLPLSLSPFSTNNFPDRSAFLRRPPLSEWPTDVAHCTPQLRLCRYAHLLEGDRIFLCLVDSRGNVAILLDHLDCIDEAIQSQSHVKFLTQDKIGETYLFVFDESKRMLAIYVPAKVCAFSLFLTPARPTFRRCNSVCSYLTRSSKICWDLELHLTYCHFMIRECPLHMRVLSTGGKRFS